MSKFNTGDKVILKIEADLSSTSRSVGLNPRMRQAVDHKDKFLVVEYSRGEAPRFISGGWSWHDDDFILYIEATCIGGE